MNCSLTTDKSARKETLPKTNATEFIFDTEGLIMSILVQTRIEWIRKIVLQIEERKQSKD